MPSSFGNLIDDDHQADAGLEADQHRLGDEVRDEAEAQERGQQQHGADQQRQRRAGAPAAARLASLGDAGPSCGGQ